MSFAKRIFLFIALNALVLVTISILLRLFGVGPYLTAYGIDYKNLLGFCLIWGMSGAFISLSLSRIMAKKMMGVQVIDLSTRNQEFQELVQTVHHLAKAAHLSAMPEVGVYESTEVNAFATGPMESRSLVAVSTGLLKQMNAEEREGVLGHEISHIANGDMVTMALLQGVVNAFVMFLSRAIAFALSNAMRGDQNDRDRRSIPLSGFFLQMFLEVFFMVLGSLLVARFSRYREFRADAGGARLAGRENMIRALERLRRTFETVDSSSQPSIQALKISGRHSGLMALFASHPSLDDRIARLKQAF